MRLDVLLLNGDTAAACPLARDQAAQTDDATWQRALIYCQILANDGGLAELGLSMLPEGGTPEDAVFTQTALALIGNRRPNVGTLRDPSPLLLAMLRGARVALPASLLDTASPAILAALATNAATPAAQRLVAADRAELYGALDTRVLLQVYDGVGFTARENTNLAEVADSDRRPCAAAPRSIGSPRRRATTMPALPPCSVCARRPRARLHRPGGADRHAGLDRRRPEPGARRLRARRGARVAARRQRRFGGALALDCRPRGRRRAVAAAAHRRGRTHAPRRRRRRRLAARWRPAMPVSRARGSRSFARWSPRSMRSPTNARGAPALRDVAAEGEGLAALRAAATAGRRSETALQAVRVLGANPGPNAVATVVRALGSVGFVAEARAVALEAAVAAGL